MLAVTKGGNVLRLEVDQQSNHTLGPAPATWANALVPLHLGGLPGECGLGLGAGGGGRLPWAPGAEVESGEPRPDETPASAPTGPFPPLPQNPGNGLPTTAACGIWC